MNKLDCQTLVDAYVSWLRRGVTAELVGDGVCELTTPFLDRHNDHLQIYAVREGTHIVLSDDGEVIGDLASGGVDVLTGKRRELLEATVNGFGVHLDHGRLEVQANEGNLGQRVHSLIQAMLAVNDMYVLARTRVASIFWDDVRVFLDDHDVRYSPRVKLSGKSGFDHAIDFLIPKSKERPERLVQAIGNPQKSAITSYLFVLSDTLSNRPSGSRAFAVLNDSVHPASSDVVDALRAYDVTPAVWSDRERLLTELVA
ncbi:MAG TPA: DUF1829 domain-containing protein [Candidatus Angelobacter sp.]|jgi:hypothetical protein|nr:DUF1829 domain-containing protein [Candidatus Angelobacter sp.]